MNQKKKRSPCCIGCGVLAFVGVGLGVVLSIFSYRFAKDNVGFISVVSKADPATEADAETLLPVNVGAFERGPISHNLGDIPQLKDVATSGVLGKYTDPQGNYLSVIAVPTAQVNDNSRQPLLISSARKADMRDDNAISMKEPFSKTPNTLVMWTKPNWSYFVHTTSTVAADFVEAFEPGGASANGSEDSATSVSVE